MTNNASSTLTFVTDRINHATIQKDEIISLIRQQVWTVFPWHILLLCDDYIILPLQIIFVTNLSISVYPDMWKLSNATPIIKAIHN